MAFSRNRLLALLFATTLALPTVASADDVAKSKKLFKQAEKQFAQKKFDEALRLYQQAYENKPLAGFHLNIGQCHRNLGQYDKAIEQYNLYLQKAKLDKRKDEVNGLIKLCEVELAKQAPPPVEPEPTPAPEETPPELTKQPAPEPKPEARSRGLNPLFFWGGVGLTGAMVLTGTITGAVALSKTSCSIGPVLRKTLLAAVANHNRAFRALGPFRLDVDRIRPGITGLLLLIDRLTPNDRGNELAKLTKALRGRFETHRRWARWTLPIWFYVSVTGVLVYVVLYVIYGARPVLSGS